MVFDDKQRRKTEIRSAEDLASDKDVTYRPSSQRQQQQKVFSETVWNNKNNLKSEIKELRKQRSRKPPMQEVDGEDNI